VQAVERAFRVLKTAYISRGKLLRRIVKIAPKTRISSLTFGSETAASAAGLNRGACGLA
jgi:hypothetical protein